MSQDILSMLDGMLPDGWERDSDVYGLDFNLVCPHGRTIEQDGWHRVTADEAEGFEGVEGEVCESPIRTLGLI